MRDFVGRMRELGELRRLIPCTSSSAGSARLIVGNAGIGKTRLAHEVASTAAECGAAVVWGRCWDEGTTRPYWPWVQIVRALRGSERGSDLAELVLGSAGGADRMELFDATSQVIEEAAATSPLVIVIDDLHHADAGSIGLLRYLADGVVTLPVLVLGTHRPLTGERDDVVAQLDALGRRVGTIELSGLAVDEVADLLPSAWSVEHVHAATGGNPLFVGEVARLSFSGGQIDGSLIEVVGRRLDALDPAIADVVSAVAVLGPDASPEAIARVAQVARVDEVGDLIASARAADLVVDDGDRHATAHPLIAEAAIARLDEPQRQHFHAVAASLFVELEGRATDVAAHLLAAGPDHRAAGIAAARAAAVAASGTMAYEDAADLLERAIVALLDDPELDPAVHLDVLLEFGDAARRANRLADSDRAYDQAWDLAVEVGDHEPLARAALRSGIRYYFSGDLSDTEVPRTLAALDSLPPRPVGPARPSARESRAQTPRRRSCRVASSGHRGARHGTRTR